MQLYKELVLVALAVFNCPKLDGHCYIAGNGDPMRYAPEGRLRQRAAMPPTLLKKVLKKGALRQAQDMLFGFMQEV